MKYRVDISMPDNTYRLNWFTFPDSIGHFEVIDRQKIDSGMGNGNLNFSQVISLTNFDSGRHVIPPFELNFTTLDGDSTFVVLTDSFPVNVLYSPQDSIEPFHDIKNILEVKDQWPWWYWAIILLAALLIVLLIIKIVKYVKSKKTTKSLFTSKIPAYEEAIQALEDLEAAQLIQSGKIKEYHIRLTEIFKRYYSRKLNVSKMHLTSEEILLELGGLDLPKKVLTDFAINLRLGNAVKFAQYIPPVSENENSRLQTKEMIITVNQHMDKNAINGL